MSFNKQISAAVFRAIETVNILELSKCSEIEIRPILPCLVRMSLITPVDTSNRWLKHKQDILAILTGIELVNSIVALLSIDFHALEADVKREQQLRQKPGSSQNDSILIGSPSFATTTNGGLALEYERSDMTRRLRLVLSELLFIQSQVRVGQQEQNDSSQSADQSDFYIKSSELFDNDIYVEEIADVICIALAELPTLLNIVHISETLLHICNGPAIICRIVANFPDSFTEVCSTLIQRGERQEEALSSSVRGAVISMLCRMNPWQSLNVRSKCVELCRMPALAVSLSLDHRTNADSDMLPFITGLLLGNDVSVRNWFAMFIRSGTKRKGEVSSTALQQLRDELLRRLQRLLDTAADANTPGQPGRLVDDVVVQASSLLRLYCALRGIGSIKFQDDEIYSIVQLITLHPNPSAAGVRFVSIGLCMLIACSSLIALQEHERKCIEWVQWLVREEVYFESGSGVSASFGEMLLLMAIHFHSNQLSAICELVCTTLGMKITIRHNNMARMKQVFTQEIFTEQVVTAHAVKVPVTHNLNATMSGFLPIHCIHQLLRSRLFAKHNVNIKQWIYRQVCASVAPLHSVLPALLEAFVCSVVVGGPGGVGGARDGGRGECCKQPLTENEIRKVFQQSAIGKYVEMPSKSSDTALENCSSTEENLTPQLLLLYYLLLYEDMRLNNANTLITHNRKIRVYSPDFLSELPIKYLLTHAQRDQSSYSTLFGPLLRLLTTHFPHLTLTEDWLDDMTGDNAGTASGSALVRFTPIELLNAFKALDRNDVEEGAMARLARMLQQLLAACEPINIWPYASVLTAQARRMLDAKLPRYLQDLYKDVWFRLNAVLPRRLWVLTVRSLRVGGVGGLQGIGGGIEFGDALLGKVDIADDPLQIMRCDERVFRCAPIYAIVLRVLRASLASSRSQLAQHLQAHPRLDQNGIPILDPEREDMCRTLITGQESAAIQMLLESCLETEEDRSTAGHRWALQEVRSMVCCYIHQVFIATPALAKLVHFQGYPSELLEVTVKGVPSMHICLDYLQELMQQPSMKKQVFAIQLLAHLSVQYALPRSLSLCAMALNLLYAMLSSVSSRQRIRLFQPILPALVEIADAFPPLIDDIGQLLTQVGRMARSQAALDTRLDAHLSRSEPQVAAHSRVLCEQVELCFQQILDRALLLNC